MRLSVSLLQPASHTFPGCLLSGSYGWRLRDWRRLLGMDLIVVLLAILLVLGLVGGVALNLLLWALAAFVVLLAVLGQGRHYVRRR